MSAEDFYALFPHVDLANAIYAANTGQISAGMVEWLWRDGIISQQVSEISSFLDTATQDYNNGKLTEEKLLEMFPNLPIEEAMGLLGNPGALYALWINENWRIEQDKRDIQRGWDATADRYTGLAEGISSGEIIPRIPFTLNGEIKWGYHIWNNLPTTLDAGNFYGVSRALNFAQQGSYTSISINRSNLPWLYRNNIPGFPQNLNTIRQSQWYLGTRYLTTNLAHPPSRIIGNQIGLKSGLFAILTGLGTTTYDFTLGDKVGGAAEDFAASAVVDVGVNAAVSLASVAMVAGIAAILGAVFSLTIAAPILVGAGVVAGLAIGIGVDANLSDEIENLKDSVSKGFHAWQGNFEIIGSAFEQAFNREATETEEGTDGIEDQNE